jgi:hypothetical protein
LLSIKKILFHLHSYAVECRKAVPFQLQRVAGAGIKNILVPNSLFTVLLHFPPERFSKKKKKRKIKILKKKK